MKVLAREGHTGPRPAGKIGVQTLRQFGLVSHRVGEVVVAAAVIDDIVALFEEEGVAGGPVDKSWLLLQGLAAKRHGMDLAAEVERAWGPGSSADARLASAEVVTLAHAAGTFRHLGLREQADAAHGRAHQLVSSGRTPRS